MVTLHHQPQVLQDGRLIPAEGFKGDASKTMAWDILQKHNTSGNPRELKLRFDAIASHDITYVGIVQTARASGLERFPLPYVLTNCHNSLCAVGGTINADDHAFGLSAAKKYGGEFVPPHMAVIHQYMRERHAGGGKMILASDSHTRYGPYGTIAVGEGGPELVKQLLERTYDLSYPDVVAVRLEGSVLPGVGPQDVAIAIIGETFSNGFVKNRLLEFFGPGVSGLSMDFRNGIDVMTTETACLSTIWQTDDTVKAELARLNRAGEYIPLSPQEGALYQRAITVDLGKIEPMIAMPFHPSRAYSISEFNLNAADILRQVEKDAREQWGLKETPSLTTLLDEKGRLRVSQGIIAGCSGGLAQNIRAAKNILKEPVTDAFNLSVYPASQPMMLELTNDGTLSALMSSGAVIRSAFCGPCFGAGDVPACNGFSIRHTTRNFPNREGSKPDQGQSAYVALMDARSIAATAANGGILTAASQADIPAAPSEFDDSPYRARVYSGVGKPDSRAQLVFGPNISDWPKMEPLPDDLLLTVNAAIFDPVTTTDELIPSGDTSSYRSNPLKLAEFTLSRKDPGYVGRCKLSGYGSVVCALRPGDGSAREQAASCQRVLGGIANIALEYATKRYRSNLINWGMLPFIWDDLDKERPSLGDTIYIPNLKQNLISGAENFEAVWTHGQDKKTITLRLLNLTNDERDIVLAGCLMNYYNNNSETFGGGTLAEDVKGAKAPLSGE